MNIRDLLSLKEEQHIGILGVGVEQTQFLDWLIRVVGFDVNRIHLADKNKNSIESAIQNLGVPISRTYYGDDYLHMLKQPEIHHIFKTPGMWSLSPELEAFRAERGPRSVHSSLVFFLDSFKQQIIGVTGTKGKSTTASMIAHLINSTHGYTAYYCGNTSGISPYQFWTSMDSDVMSQLVQTTRFVIELSSFQLQDLAYDNVSPHTSVVTNYYIDHLDQHLTAEEYWLCKDTIFINQTASDIVIISPTVQEHSPSIGRIGNHIIIGTEEAVRNAEFFELPLKGLHNAMNFTMAIHAYAHALMVEEETSVPDFLQKYATALKESIATFISLPHRIQPIRSVNIGSCLVNFWDDGYATEPDAIKACLDTLTQGPRETVWLWLAGKNKKGDYGSLVTKIIELYSQNKIANITFCGAVGQYISALIQHYREFGNLEGINEEYIAQLPLNLLREEVVRQIPSLAAISEFVKISPIINDLLGDTDNPPILHIVLSPGGSSFDEFMNASERADWWTSIINKAS